MVKKELGKLDMELGEVMSGQKTEKSCKLLTLF